MSAEPTVGTRGDGHGPPRSPTPPTVAWLRDEAGLRPPSIARLLGVAPDAYARWCGARAAATEDVPLLGAGDALYRRVCAAIPDRRTRSRWWTEAQRELGWISPAELLRRGKIGEVFLLTAGTPGDRSAGERQGED